MAEENKDPKEETTDKKDAKVKPGSMQSVSLKDYLDKQQKEANKKKFTVPKVIKIILMLPFLLIFLFGIFYVPFIIYQIAVGDEKKVESKK